MPRHRSSSTKHLMFNSTCTMLTYALSYILGTCLNFVAVAAYSFDEEVGEWTVLERSLRRHPLFYYAVVCLLLSGFLLLSVPLASPILRGENKGLLFLGASLFPSVLLASSRLDIWRVIAGMAVTGAVFAVFVSFSGEWERYIAEEKVKLKLKRRAEVPERRKKANSTTKTVIVQEVTSSVELVGRQLGRSDSERREIVEEEGEQDVEDSEEDEAERENEKEEEEEKEGVGEESAAVEEQRENDKGDKEGGESLKMATIAVAQRKKDLPVRSTAERLSVKEGDAEGGKNSLRSRPRQ